MKEFKTYTVKFESDMYKKLKYKTIESDMSMQDLLIKLIQIGITNDDKQTNQNIQMQ